MVNCELQRNHWKRTVKKKEELNEDKNKITREIRKGNKQYAKSLKGWLWRIPAAFWMFTFGLLWCFLKLYQQRKTSQEPRTILKSSWGSRKCMESLFLRTSRYGQLWECLRTENSKNNETVIEKGKQKIKLPEGKVKFLWRICLRMLKAMTFAIWAKPSGLGLQTFEKTSGMGKSKLLLYFRHLHWFLFLQNVFGEMSNIISFIKIMKGPRFAW